MPKITYQEFNPRSESLQLLIKADQVLAEYEEQGYDVTLRQLYYHFVAHDLFPDSWKFSRVGSKWVRDLDKGTKNAEPNYKNFGSLLNDGRMGGYIDWNHLIDRGRNLKTFTSWDHPRDIVSACAAQFNLDHWKDQPFHVEVWVEKEALVGVIERPCSAWQVPFFACKGYTSQSEMWSAGQRLSAKLDDGKEVLVIHLGDHDPSGVDMTRDIEDRIRLFSSAHGGRGERLTIDRIALNMDQIRQYNPPPNPTKMSDSRATGYVDEYGEECWELDALDVKILHTLVEERIKEVVDYKAWRKVLNEQKVHRADMSNVAQNWDEISRLYRK